MKLMRYLLMLSVCLFVLCELSACGSSLPVIKPYKLDIQQGNVVTSKMLLQLKPGMTKSQVRYIMGTPLIVDSFHKDRWDYFYQMRQAGKVIEQRRVILDFEKDALTRIRGDVVPQGTSGAATGEVIGSTTTADMLKEKEETSILDKLQFWKSDKKSVPPPVEVAKPAVAVTPVEVAKPAVAVTPEEVAKPLDVTKPLEEAKPEDTTKAPEKSWTDKLMFWKKKDETPIAKPIEAKKEMVQDVTAPSAKTIAPSDDSPSVLAVPIGLEVAPAPQAEASPETESVKVEPLPATEPLKVEPLPKDNTESTKPLPKAEDKPVPKAEVKPEPKAEEVKVITPVIPRPLVHIPTKNKQPLPNNKQDEKKIFRLDRTLKIELLNEPEPPKETEPIDEKPAVEKSPVEIVKPKKKAAEEPLPAETEPTFFDRMLEKIGF
jgi:outer membrane protein assembly factor BamE